MTSNAHATKRTMALLLAALPSLLGCLEDLTVGFNTKLVVSDGGGGPDGATPSPDAGDPGPSVDAGPIVDVRPCTASDCGPIVGIAMENKTLICATETGQECVRNAMNQCEWLCPEVPIAKSCSNGMVLQKCGSDTFCKNAIGDCNGSSGACESVPSTCDTNSGPTYCGCDGVTYDSACQAHALGINLDYEGVCP